MAPVQPGKRKSGPSSASPQRSPIKKQKLGTVTLAQKQALIDNLQLEITERARRLRAQYNIQAQQLRSRVEMRVNRIPRTLRKLRMDELSARLQQQQKSRPVSNRPLQDPTNVETSTKPIPQEPLSTAGETAGHVRFRNELSGGNKENRNEGVDVTLKRPRGPPPSQVLSPTSSNTRILHRELPISPKKSALGLPASPMKTLAAKASSNILSSIVDKATVTRPALTTKTAIASSTDSANSGAAATAAGRALKATTPLTGSGRRRASVTSDSGEDNKTAVVNKKATAGSRVTKKAPAAKKTVANTAKSATAKKAPAAKAATATAGRTLRKRG